MHQIKFVIPCLLCLFFAEEKTKGEWWHKKADVMVEKQIERRGVKDPQVLKVMRETPRHRFIPPHLEKMAYNDGPLPIGEGQTISQPYIVALMTELLELKGDEKIPALDDMSGNLKLTWCGAESVPRKNFLLPEHAHFLKAIKSDSSFTTGIQK